MIHPSFRLVHGGAIFEIGETVHRLRRLRGRSLGRDRLSAGETFWISVRERPSWAHLGDPLSREPLSASVMVDCCVGRRRPGIVIQRLIADHAPPAWWRSVGG